MDRFTAKPVLIDSHHGPYLGVYVPRLRVLPEIWTMRRLLGDATALHCTWRRRLRDGLRHHITVVTPQEWARRPDAAVDDVPLSFDLSGLGAARSGGSIAFYALVASDDAARMRARLGLGPHDLHVTLGFVRSDVHDVDKGPATWVPVAGNRRRVENGF